MTDRHDLSATHDDLASPPLPLAARKYAAQPSSDAAAPPDVRDLQPPLPMPPRLYGAPPPGSAEREHHAEPIAEIPLDPPPLPMAPRNYPPAQPEFARASHEIVAPAPLADVIAPLPVARTAAVAPPAPAPPNPSPPLPVAPVASIAPSAEANPLARPTGGWLDLARRAVMIAGYVVVGWLALILMLIVAFRVIDPPTSSLMAQQWLSGQDVTQEWIDLDDVSADAIRAVLLSEDGRFCQHYGIDFEEMQNAIERARDGAPRGASTISMQVVKNLFLWPSRSYVRKAIEIPLTYVMEAVWPKSRIMEVYLNIAEWGPGIFGVESAARHHFNKSASRLSEREAARLAVALPNPFLRDAGDPGPRTRRLAADIQGRMRAAPASQTACVVAGRSSRPAPKPRAKPAPRDDDGGDWDAEIRRFP
jgi:monofunctional biosynthetic peptidoglycan transglycosylase